MTGDINTDNVNPQPRERESVDPSRQIAREGSLTPKGISTIRDIEQSQSLPPEFSRNATLLGQLNQTGERLPAADAPDRQIAQERPLEQLALSQAENNSKALEIKANVGLDVINRRIDSMGGFQAEKAKSVARAILTGELDEAASIVSSMNPQSAAAMGTTLNLAFRDSGISVTHTNYKGKEQFEEALILHNDFTEGAASALILTTEDRNPSKGTITRKPGQVDQISRDPAANGFDAETIMRSISSTAVNHITDKVQQSLLDEKAILTSQFSPMGAMADRNKDGQISDVELEKYRDAAQDPVEQRQLDTLLRNFSTVSGSDGNISRADAEARKAKIMEQGTLLAVADGLAGKQMRGLPDLLYGSFYSNAKATEFQDAINKKLSRTGTRIEIGPSQVDERHNESRRLNIIGTNNTILSGVDVPVRRTR